MSISVRVGSSDEVPDVLCILTSEEPANIRESEVSLYW